MDRFLLSLFLLLVGADLATARPLGVSSAEPPPAVAGVIAAPDGTAPEDFAGAPSAQGMERERPDKSIAGAEVILGGFATAVFAIIFCYIRVTRRRAGEEDARSSFALSPASLF